LPVLRRALHRPTRQAGRQVAGHASGFTLYFQGRTGGDFIEQQPCLVH
jgi:hypothetical protein